VSRIPLALTLSIAAIVGLGGRAAEASIDSNAQIVTLRTNCNGANDCFTSPSSLTSWISGTRQPTSTTPLLVDIGPGDFRTTGSFALNCGGSFGHTTFRGAGQDRTLIGQSGGFVAFAGAYLVDCPALTFQDLTVSGRFYGVLWKDGGSSTWTNTVVVGQAFGWYDVCEDVEETDPQSEHYFFSSRIESSGTYASTSSSVAFISFCGESWLWGSDVVARTGGSAIDETVAVDLNGSSDVRIFGSSVRARGHADMEAGSTVWGVRLGVTGANESPPGDGRFRMSGGLISADASSGDDVDAVALHVGGDGFAHTPATGFVVEAGASGTATRVSADSAPGPDVGAHSPFHWAPGTSPPTIVSETGADLFVETDCQGAGQACSGGSQAHLMVYDASCAAGGGPWRDMVGGACRP
jgi:hypothetical protein